MEKVLILIFIVIILSIGTVFASTSTLIYGNSSEIGYIKNSSSAFSINNNSDIIFGCYGNCSSWISRGFSFFDLNSLPAKKLIIESVYLILNVNFTNSTSLNQTVYDVNVSNWTISSNNSKYIDIGSGNNYSLNISWGQTAGNKNMRLNNQSIIDLNYSINQGLKFAIGFKNNLEINNYTFINISKNSIILNVTYTLYPYTNASAIYSDNGAKYYLGNIGNRSVNISLSCTDCLNITYCVDNVGTCTPNIIYSKSFNYSTFGYNFLRFRSNNSLGILEETKTEIIYLDPNAPTTSPIVWPECNPAEPCCNSNGYFRTSGFVCKSAYNAICINASNCTGQAYEDRCSGTSSTCPNTNNLINYPEACDDLVCLNQSCSGSTFQPERICSKEVCQTNSPYSCQNNLNCQDSTNCKKQALTSSDCKSGFLFDSNLKVCYLSNNYTYDLLYDVNGNLISIFGNETGLGWTYLYNDFNQLSSVKDEGVITLANYTYDAFGRRIKKVEYDSCFNTNTYYLGNFIQKINSSGIFNETYYYFNGLLVGKKDNTGKIFFYHPNHLGSTALITNSSGHEVEDLLYKPFGYQNDTSERYTYTGHEQDNEAGGIVYAGARYYNPELGLFLQADPVIGDLYNPQDLNKYAYARNNPYRYTDPNGEFVWFYPLAVGTAYLASTVGIWGPALYQYTLYDFNSAIDTFTNNPTIGNLFWLGLASWDVITPGIPESKIAKEVISTGSEKIAKNINKVDDVTDLNKLIEGQDKLGIGKTGGRLGGIEHRTKVGEVADFIESKGGKIISGGGYRRSEKAININGKNRFPDIRAQINGRDIFVNVGKTQKSTGNMVTREIPAFTDLSKVSEEGYTIFIPYDKTSDLNKLFGGIF